LGSQSSHPFDLWEYLVFPSPPFDLSQFVLPLSARNCQSYVTAAS
jgi:hypothetical protein